MTVPRLRFGDKLLPFAFGAIEDDAPINILEGSVRSGKTWALHPKIISACEYPVNGWRSLTGQSKQTIYTNVLSDLFSLVGPRNYSYNTQSGMLKLFGVPWIVMGAKDEGSEKFLRGSTIGIAICDEATLMPKEFFQMLLTRMSPEGARLYATTNCDTPKHWLKEEYLDDAKLRRRGLLASIHTTMEDNPNLTPSYVAAQKLLYKGLFYDRYILGLWVMAEGAIWRDSWSDDLLYDDEPGSLFNSGGFVDHWISVDVGVDHNQVYLEFWDDGDVIWVTRRYCWDSKKEMRQKTNGEYADDLMEFMGSNGCQIIVPPEAASFRLELIARGLWVTDANNEVQQGIETVASIMSARKLRVHRRRCAGLVRGIETYAWDPKKSARGKEEPLKIDDDDADALRYGLHEKVPIWRYLKAAA
jgi:PBSX family phage terminase large subunit